MYVQGKNLVLESKACGNCLYAHREQDGTVSGRKSCLICKGTGRGTRGKANGCKHCHGFGSTVDHSKRVPCPRCKGNWQGAELETTCDYLPRGIWEGLTFKVYRSDREQTGNEYLLGIGCVYTVTDYGEAFRVLSNDELIRHVRESDSAHQACKVVQEDNVLCDHVGIFVNRNGYSVRAVHSTPVNVQATIACERGKDDYFRVGEEMASNGLNGTLGALYR